MPIDPNAFKVPSFKSPVAFSERQRREQAKQQAEEGAKAATTTPDVPKGVSPLLSQFKAPPELYTIDPQTGKRVINPQYDTSPVRDMFAGVNVANKRYANGDPVQQFAATIGGLLGGLFNHDLAGKQMYEEDVARTAQYNQQINLQTEASIRAEQLANAQAAEARRQANMQFTQALKTQVEDRKTLSDKSKALRDIAMNSRDEDQKTFASRQYFALWGLDGEDPNFGAKFTERKFGDHVYLINNQDGSGELTAIKDDKTGELLNTMDTTKQLQALKTYASLNSDGDALTALKQADDYMHNSGQFSGLKANQYATVKIQIAKMIHDTSKGNPITTRDLVFGGRVISLPNLPIFGQPTSSTTPNNTNIDGNPNNGVAPVNVFNADDWNDFIGKGKLVDKDTRTSMAQWASGLTSMDDIDREINLQNKAKSENEALNKKNPKNQYFQTNAETIDATIEALNKRKFMLKAGTTTMPMAGQKPAETATGDTINGGTTTATKPPEGFNMQTNDKKFWAREVNMTNVKAGVTSLNHGQYKLVNGKWYEFRPVQ